MSKRGGGLEGKAMEALVVDVDFCKVAQNDLPPSSMVFLSSVTPYFLSILITRSAVLLPLA